MAWYLINPMCCTSSPVQAEASLEVFCSEKKLSEQLNLKSIQEKRSWPDSVMVSYQSFPSGMMSPLSDWITRKQKSISDSLSASENTSQLPEVSPAKTSALRAKALELRETVRDYGRRCAVLLAKFDRDTSCWRTPQCSLFEDSSESLETLPKYGIALRGQLWELPTLEQIIREIGFGDSEPPRNILSNEATERERVTATYPTPMATEVRQGFQNRNNGKKGTQKSLTTVVVERSSRLRAQETGKEELQTPNTCKAQTADSTGWETLTHSSGSTEVKGITFPAPRARDRGCSEKALIRKDGKDRLDQLSNFVKYGIKYPTPQAHDVNVRNEDSWRKRTAKRGNSDLNDFVKWGMRDERVADTDNTGDRASTGGTD